MAGHLADRLNGEQSQISDALCDAVRSAAHGRLDVTISGLRELMTTHSRREEQEEFPQFRRAVPVRERREMCEVVRAVEASTAAADAGSRDTARALARAAAHVRDALASF